VKTAGLDRWRHQKVIHRATAVCIFQALLFWIMGADSSTFGFKFIIQFHQNNIFELTTQCIKLIPTKLFWCRISIKLHECMKQQSPWSPMEAEKLDYSVSDDERNMKNLSALTMLTCR
jgi:hypothetical protein